MAPSVLWPPPAQFALSVNGRRDRAFVNRIFCVGRNYAAHAAEMGHAVEKAADRPFYFTKAPHALVDSGATIPYPPGTANCHYEMELVVVVGAPGFRVPVEEAAKLVFGYACGLDLTRRDLQLALREKGRPWDLGKDFENAAVISAVQPLPGTILERGAISLSVNGAVRQRSDLSNMIWACVRSSPTSRCSTISPRGTLSSPARPKASDPSIRATGSRGRSRASERSR